MWGMWPTAFFQCFGNGGSATHAARHRGKPTVIPPTATVKSHGLMTGKLSSPRLCPG